jgi:hypothetical protein
MCAGGSSRPAEEVGDCDEKACRGARVGECAMRIVECHAMVGAGLTEFASGHRQGVEANTPVDVNTHSVHLRTDHS